MKNVKIIVCAHKLADMPRHDYLLPVHAGAELAKVRLPYQPDNEGDNISAKNPHYCELTALYWGWKNLKNVDIVGLNHYRRYFDFDEKWPRFAPERRFTSPADFLSRPYRFPDLDELLSKYDIVLPNRRYYPYDVTTQYSVYHIVNDWRTLREVIHDLSPEYDEPFRQAMDRSNWMSGYNMMICRWDLFDRYCEWLFKVLFEVERRVKLSAYPDQARIFGYMSERLINVFCVKEHLRVKYVPFVMPIDEYQPWMNPSHLQFTLRKWRHQLTFRLGKF